MIYQSIRRAREPMTTSKCSIALVIATILLLVTLSSVLAQAKGSSAFVGMWGMWYCETKENKLIDGKSYDIRRELLNNRSDGTKTNTFRYYSAGKVIAEKVVTYSWGVDNGVYWTVCQTVLPSNGQSYACSTREEYDVISVNAREMHYKSRRSGTTYSSRLVADNFRLP